MCTVPTVMLHNASPGIPEATNTVVDPAHSAPPSTAANAASLSGVSVAPYRWARAWKSAAMTGAANSAMPKALPNNMDLNIVLLLINAEFVYRGPLRTYL
jgi:hypothetical protein